MSDLDTYLTHCYDLLLKSQTTTKQHDDDELCACATLVKHDETTNH